MFENNEINFPLLISILTLFGLDAFYKLTNKCTTAFGIVIGGFHRHSTIREHGYFVLLSDEFIVDKYPHDSISIIVAQQCNILFICSFDAYSCFDIRLYVWL